MKLITNWIDFEETVEGYISQALAIHESNKNGSKQEEYDTLNENVKQWQDDVIEYLKSAFADIDIEYIRAIRYPGNNRFSLGNKKDLKQLIREKLEDLIALKKTLEYYLRLLKISDAIVRSNEIDLEKRKSLSTDEISQLILEKLFELYDDSYNSIADILFGNGIELKRHGEERDIIKRLELLGLVDLISGKYVTARLTIEGKRYIENQRSNVVTDYNRINSSQEELNQKIDEIIEMLKMQNVGQEVLFEELQELKELYPKLDKKNWGQLLKGKLIDLAVGEVVNKEIVSEIFRELTHQILLLK